MLALHLGVAVRVARENAVKAHFETGDRLKGKEVERTLPKEPRMLTPAALFLLPKLRLSGFTSEVDSLTVGATGIRACGCHRAASLLCRGVR